jgi:hypothetical protein
MNLRLLMYARIQIGLFIQVSHLSIFNGKFRTTVHMAGQLDTVTIEG